MILSVLCCSNTELANIFCVFFNNKISKIRDELDSLHNGFSDSGVANTTTTSKLETFSLMEKKEPGIAISKLNPSPANLIHAQDGCLKIILRLYCQVC